MFHFSDDTMRLLSVVSTCVGILGPALSALWWVVRKVKQRTMTRFMKPTKELAGRLRVLEMSLNNDKNDLIKVKEKEENHDIEIKELETKVDLILDNKFGKKD